MSGKVLAPSSRVKACDFVGFVEYFCLKLSTTIFPFHGPSNLAKQENYFVQEGNRATW